MRCYPVFSGMSPERKPTESPLGLHCGRCIHLSHTEGEERVYFTYHDREPYIRFGDVCSEYRERENTSEEGGAGDIGLGSQRIQIDESETLPGRTGPFYAVFAEGENQGRFCSACQDLEVTADPMGRKKCSRCGNGYSSHRWGSAYR